MDDLNRNQFILLVLLVTFVTSIATGIMTATLLQEAPIEVTRNINRVVEKTIETVTIPGTTSNPQQKEVVTVIVKEEDLIIDSINKNLKSIVRIKERDGLLLTTSFYGIGLVVSSEGIVSADRKSIFPGNTYTAVMSDGTEFNLTPTGAEKQTNFILFKVVQPETSSTTKKYVFTPAALADAEPKLGQTIIGLGGNVSNAVSVGRVVSLDMKESGTGTSTVSTLVKINTDMSPRDLVSGSPVFNLSGDVIGIQLTSDLERSFTPIAILKKELVTLTETPKTP